MKRREPFLELRNRYYVLRHGRSLANQQKRIISSPDEGVLGWGLSPEGLSQIKADHTDRKFDRKPRIYSSDFLRAKETAGVFALAVNGRVCGYDPRLRERFFGDLDGTDDSNYSRVWEEDKAQVLHSRFHAETADHVLQRLLDFLFDKDQTHHDETIILVSHGDPLNILCAAFNRLPAHRHREIPPVATGELRELRI